MINSELLGLLGRCVLINIIPFFLVFELVMRRRQVKGAEYSELALVAGEIQTAGIMGYFVIMSIFFFSIPVLQYYKQSGYEILLVEPDGITVFIIAYVSYSLVVSGIYMKYRRRWAYYAAVFMLTILMIYAFFSILEYGWFSSVPAVVFSYLLYRVKRPSLRLLFESPRHGG